MATKTHPEVTKLLRSLLEIMDNMERAVNALEDSGTPPAVADGVRSIHRQLTDVFYKWDLRAFSSYGTPFDPMRHEAIGRTHVPELDLNTVAEEIRRGYMLGESLFRPSQVVVNTEMSTTQSTAAVKVTAPKRARTATRSAVNRPGWLLNPPKSSERTIYMVSSSQGTARLEQAQELARDAIVPELLEWCTANLDDSPIHRSCEPLAWALRGSGATGLWEHFLAAVPTAEKWVEDHFWEKVKTEAKGAVYDVSVLIAVPREAFETLLIDDSEEKWHGLTFANPGPLLKSVMGELEGGVLIDKNPAVAGGRQLLEPGDVVLRVANRPTPDAASVRRLLTMCSRTPKTFDIQVSRGVGEPRRMRLSPPRR